MEFASAVHDLQLFGIIRGMERIATDTYSFADIRNGGFVYVDKTAILKTLADGFLGTQFFISRLRRPPRLRR